MEFEIKKIKIFKDSVLEKFFNNLEINFSNWKFSKIFGGQKISFDIFIYSVYLIKLIYQWKDENASSLVFSMNELWFKKMIVKDFCRKFLKYGNDELIKKEINDLLNSKDVKYFDESVISKKIKDLENSIKCCLTLLENCKIIKFEKRKKTIEIINSEIINYLWDKTNFVDYTIASINFIYGYYRKIFFYFKKDKKLNIFSKKNLDGKNWYKIYNDFNHNEKQNFLRELYNSKEFKFIYSKASKHSNRVFNKVFLYIFFVEINLNKEIYLTELVHLSYLKPNRKNNLNNDSDKYIIKNILISLNNIVIKCSKIKKFKENIENQVGKKYLLNVFDLCALDFFNENKPINLIKRKISKLDKKYNILIEKTRDEAEKEWIEITKKSYLKEGKKEKQRKIKKLSKKYNFLEKLEILKLIDYRMKQIKIFESLRSQSSKKLERDFHNFFFFDKNNHNLWIIDENLGYLVDFDENCDIGSDKRIGNYRIIDGKNRKLRPDILLGQLSSESNANFPKITIIEFKNYGRKQLYKEKNDPNIQLNKYLDQIKFREKIDKENTFWELYSVCSIDSNYRKKLLSNHFLEISKDGKYCKTIQKDDQLILEIKQRYKIFEKKLEHDIKKILNSKSKIYA